MEEGSVIGGDARQRVGVEKVMVGGECGVLWKDEQVQNGVANALEDLFPELPHSCLLHAQTERVPS